MSLSAFCNEERDESQIINNAFYEKERNNRERLSENEDDNSDLLGSDVELSRGETLPVVEHRRLTACRFERLSSSSPSSDSSSLASSSEVECKSDGGMLEGVRYAAALAPISLKQQQQQLLKPQQQQQLMSGEIDRGWRWGAAGLQALHEQKPEHSVRLKEDSISDDFDAQMSTLDPSSLQLQNNLQFRFLHPDDIDELKSLCKDCFPVEYPEEWYQEITKDDGRFFSLASTLRGRIVGFIVAEIKTRVRCNKEDQDILSPSYPLSTPIAYILSLGVLCPFRCQGVGSLLLDNLLNHLTSKDHHTCKAVFLHVLCTNSRAIRFYERRHFAKHSFLPLYYSIQGKLKDGYSYVLYLNGGHPPWSLRSSVAASCAVLASFSPCKMSSRFLLRANHLLWCFLAAVFVSIKRTTATSTASASATTTTNTFPHGYHKS